MSFKKPTPKASQVTQSTQPAASAVKKERVKKSPEKLLQFKTKGDGEELQMICGLFKEVSKNKGVEYHTGCNTEEKIRFYVFTNKNGVSLMMQDYGTNEKDLKEICKLEKRSSKKDGSAFLVGKTDDGDYFVFDRKAKE